MTVWDDGRDGSDNVGEDGCVGVDVGPVLEGLSFGDITASVKASKVVPDMWLEPHNLAEVHWQYIDALQEKWDGDVVVSCVNNMKVPWLYHTSLFSVRRRRGKS